MNSWAFSTLNHTQNIHTDLLFRGEKWCVILPAALPTSTGISKCAKAPCWLHFTTSIGSFSLSAVAVLHFLDNVTSIKTETAMLPPSVIFNKLFHPSYFISKSFSVVRLYCKLLNHNLYTTWRSQRKASSALYHKIFWNHRTDSFFLSAHFFLDFWYWHFYPKALTH